MKSLTNKLLVWEILQSHKGKANSISQNDLAAQVGVQPRCAREIVKSLIENDREKICSNYDAGGGYFIPESDAEIKEARQKLKSHAISIFKRYSALDGNIKELQMELFGGANGTN